MNQVQLGGRGRTALIYILGVGLTAFLLLLVYAVLTSATKSTEIRDTQQDNSPVLAEVQKGNRQIASCVRPSGKCYQRNERRTAAVVGDIGRYIVLASACAADVSPTMPVSNRITAITDCVTDRLGR